MSTLRQRIGNTVKKTGRPVLLVIAMLAAALPFAASPASAAVGDVSWHSFRPNTGFNDFSIPNMGIFDVEVAPGLVRKGLCMDPNTAHANSGYSLFAPFIAGSLGTVGGYDAAWALSTLTWLADSSPLLGGPGSTDADRAAAFEGLGWYWTQPVSIATGLTYWPDSFGNSNPLYPEPWNTLTWPGPWWGPFNRSLGFWNVSNATPANSVNQWLYNIYQENVRLIGPWSLAFTTFNAGPNTMSTVLLNGQSQPISGQTITFTFPGGGSATATTNASGVATVTVPVNLNGTATASIVNTPGLAEIWGAPGAQPIAVATAPRPLSSDVLVNTQQIGYLQVNKTSSSGLSVNGTEFQLRDVNGNVVQTQTVNNGAGGSGSVTFSNINQITNPGPWTVWETVVPPGHVPVTNPVATVNGPLSTDPGSPTVAGVSNITLKHIQVNKTSSSGLSVNGTEFQLRDVNGNVVQTQTVNNGAGGSGSVTFSNINQITNPGPWTVWETVVPPGHIPAPNPVATINGPLSADPGSPSVANVNNITLKHLRVNKTSAGGYLPVNGATFELRDSNNVVVGTQTVSNNSHVTFSNINQVTNPGPWTLSETVTPPGHDAPINPVATISSLAAGANPANPVTIDVSNTPVQPLLTISKELSDPSMVPDGGDLSGFEFSVTRDDGADFGSHATDSLGSTLQVGITPGSYSICEVALPAWAQAITDAPVCQTLVVPPGTTTGEAVSFTFTNNVRTINAATLISTPVASAGDTVTERIWMADSIDSRLLRADVELFSSTPSLPASAMVCDANSATGVTGSLQFSGSPNEQLVEIELSLPENITGVAYWAAGTVTDVDTNIVVATLPCGDVNERVIVPSISTVSPWVVEPADAVNGGGIVDTYTVEGIPAEFPVDPWIFSAEFPLHDITVSCRADSVLVGTMSERVLSNGTFTTARGVNVPEPGVYVFREVLTVDWTHPSAPPGFSISSPDPTEGTWTSTPELCNDAETTWVPSLSTRVQDKVLTGQPSIDWVTVAGIPQTLDAADSVTVIGGMFRHAASTPLSSRVCTAGNLVESISPISMTGAGIVSTSPIVGYPVGVSVSYSESLSISRTKIIDGDPVTQTFVTTPHGCQEEAQTSYVPELVTTVANAAPTEPGTMTDFATVTGLPEPLPANWEVRIEGGLHRHAADSVLGERVCDAENMVATIDMPINGNGTWETSGEAFEIGPVYSYQERLRITVPNDTTVYLTAWHGCNELAQTFAGANSGDEEEGDEEETAEEETDNEGDEEFTSTGASVVWPLSIAGSLAVLGGLILLVNRRRQTA
jgi:hypothetical protein